MIEDHWPVPFMGGVLTLVEEGSKIQALELTFEHQSTDYAPKVEPLQDGPVKMNITVRDQLLPLVTQQLGDAMAFLECMYDIDLNTDQYEIFYEPENSEENSAIPMKHMSRGKREQILPLTFDMFTRAFMAAETNVGPHFEATLSTAARKALQDKKYIDSFRYSFLLFEALFGDGQFKSASLKSALSRNPIFSSIVSDAIKDRMKPRYDLTSDTELLLKGTHSVSEVIGHLVDKRGYFFHGNTSRKDAWKPNDQRVAESLALLSIGIAQAVTMRATSPLFAEENGARHFQDAVNSGAQLVFEVKFRFQEPNEGFSRDGALTINTPGTKVTRRKANELARNFLATFEHNAPVASLISAECRLNATNQKVFELTCYGE